MIKLALTIHRDFMQGLLYQILSGGAIETSNYRISDICQSAVECRLIVLFKGFLTGLREVALDGNEVGGIGGKLPPTMLKKL